MPCIVGSRVTLKGESRPMHIIFIAILALAVPPAQLDTSATPTTRLFVRTVPVGAAVTVDGKTIGKSDGLFAVPAGTHKITVGLGRRLDGRLLKALRGPVNPS